MLLNCKCLYIVMTDEQIALKQELKAKRKLLVSWCYQNMLMIELYLG